MSMQDDQAPQQSPSADDLWSTAAGFGVTPSTVKMMLAPLVQDVMTESLKGLPATIEKMVTAQTDQLVAEIVDKVKAAITGAVGGATSGGGDAGEAVAAGVNPMAAMLMQAVIAKFTGPAVAPAAAPVEAVSQFANSMSTLWSNVFEPLMGIYGQGASDERRRMTDMHKMGYDVPIGGPVAPVETVPGPVGAPVATMNQPRTTRDAAKAVAASIKLAA